MRLLFIHQNFPGQFLHTARALAKRSGTEVVALTDKANRQSLAGIKTGRYETPKPPPESLTRASAILASRFQRAEAVARALSSLRRQQFHPDVIVGHPGWGELMLVKEFFPDARLVSHAEFYYSTAGADVGFDAEFPNVSDGLRAALKARNVPLISAVLDSTVAVAPTAWQASRFPEELRGKIRQIHEGIDTTVARPDASADYGHGLDGRVLKAGDEIITFVNRNLEPMRGFHIFMRALPAILKARPEARAVIVGGDGVSYGPPPASGGSWKARLLDEVGARLPLERVHFVGRIPYPEFIRLMQVTRLHAYATYPFVLSWSMLEAMSAGALVLGSATPPVTEMIEDGRNGLLYDFFDTEGLATRAIEALAEPTKFAPIRHAARQTIIDRFDMSTVCLPQWLSLIDSTAAG